VTVFYNADVSGTGEYEFGSGTRINFVLARVRSRGPRCVATQVADGCVNAGWFALGAASDSIDGVERTYWTHPVWIDFESFEWHPIPTTDAFANDFGVWASAIRWHMLEGTTVGLFVYGV
jgi:hypothetical protein